MSWIYKKINSIIYAALAAIGGLFASQIDSFILQYLQRLGGHLGEATSNLERILNSTVYQTMEESVRKALELDAISRVNTLQNSYDMINNASFLFRPIKLLLYSEEKIITGTIDDYIPSLNFNSHTVFYVLISILIILILLDLIKSGIAIIISYRRKRKFKTSAKIS